MNIKWRISVNNGARRGVRTLAGHKHSIQSAGKGERIVKPAFIYTLLQPSATFPTHAGEYPTLHQPLADTQVEWRGVTVRITATVGGYVRKGGEGRIDRGRERDKQAERGLQGTEHVFLDAHEHTDSNLFSF